MKKFFLILFILTSYLPFSKVHAEGGIEVTPSFSELKLKPGESYAGSFLIKNNNEYNVLLDVSKGEITPDGKINLETNNNSSSNWITTVHANIRINSLNEFTFTYSIKIPDGITDQTIQPIFILKLVNDGTESGATTGISQLIPFQFRILVNQTGEYNADLDIVKLQASKSILIGSDQTIAFEVKNPSTSPAKPLIRLQVVSPDNQIIYQSVENENLSVLLTDQSILKENNISNAITTDLKPGRYNIELLVTDTLTSKSTIQKLSFYYIPLQIFIIIVILTIAFVILATLLLRFRKRKSFEKVTKKRNHIFMHK
ncbi:MAG: hypothetical protein ABI721_05065 [Candidatus Dojkabacteria bacterium]